MHTNFVFRTFFELRAYTWETDRLTDRRAKGRTRNAAYQDVA